MSADDFNSAPEVVLKEVERLQERCDVLGQRVRWYPERWKTLELAVFHEGVHKFADNCIRDGDKYFISRQNVVEIGKDAQQIFIGAMIFGYGDRGYGPSRVKKVLDNVNVENKLHLQFVAAKNGPEASWVCHTRDAKLKFLGPAFATKFAYFAARQQKVKGEIPLIADINTSWAMWELAKIPRSIGEKEGYLSYVRLAHEWGARLGAIGPDEVERALFEIGKSLVPKRL